MIRQYVEVWRKSCKCGENNINLGESGGFVPPDIMFWSKFDQGDVLQRKHLSCKYVLFVDKVLISRLNINMVLEL